MYRTVILPSVLYGCETLSLTLREDQEHCMLRFVICTLLRVYANWNEQVKEAEMGRTCGTKKGREECIGILCAGQKERDH
jgi:hypothetical protein